MKIAIFCGVVIGLFVFTLSPKSFTLDSLTLTILLGLIAGVGNLLYKLKKDQI